MISVCHVVAAALAAMTAREARRPAAMWTDPGLSTAIGLEMRPSRSDGDMLGGRASKQKMGPGLEPPIVGRRRSGERIGRTWLLSVSLRIRTGSDRGEEGLGRRSGVLLETDITIFLSRLCRRRENRE